MKSSLVVYNEAEPMDIKIQLQKAVQGIVSSLYKMQVEVSLEHPQEKSHGDYATNVALVLSKGVKKSPREVAEEIQKELVKKNLPFISGVDVAGPGFINIHLSDEVFSDYLKSVLGGQKKVARTANPPVIDPEAQTRRAGGLKIMVEFAHPNTHKEMHIGHMRTLITGEALSRILEANGNKIYRANYQGDIGPHVAKALFGIEVLLKEQKKDIEEIEKLSNTQKAHFLGVAYARGNEMYEDHKHEIDALNSKLYQKDTSIWPLYERTRKWSLDYYEEFYKRFGTRFDRLFFESEMAQKGKEIVLKHVGKVFAKDQGAIVFRGEEYGLHTRVFVTQAGNPTYEGKEMANALAEYSSFPFDQKIHVVASEQAGYFKVVFKALESIDPEKFKDKQFHLSMGMVQLVGRKMSSRTGDVLTVDNLLDDVKASVEKLFTENKIDLSEQSRVLEQVTIGAVKYSILRVSATQDVSFDIQKSVSLDGDSGPYLQYTYARTRSVLDKVKNQKSKGKSHWEFYIESLELKTEELSLLKTLFRFEEVVEDAAKNLSPNFICTYLFDLAQEFNLFYQKCPILKEKHEIKQFRLALTAGVGKTLKDGLNLLGIDAPERM